MHWLERLLRRHGRVKRGQALVEFALVVSLFLLLVLGTLEFGRAIIIITSLQNAAREGARYAVIKPTDTPGIVRAAQRTVVIVGTGGMNVTVTYPNGTSTQSDPVKVSVSYGFHFLLPVISKVFGPAGLTLSYSSQMDIE